LRRQRCRSGDMSIIYGHLNIVIFVGIGTLSFCAVNMDVVSLFADLATLDLNCIDVLNQFE